MKKTILTLVFGTIILFLWNGISWMALPFHNNTMHDIPDEAMDESTLREHMTESGVYHYPGLPGSESPEEMAKIEKRLSEGPRITMMVYKSGPSKFFDPMTFLISLFLDFLTVLLTLYVITKIEPKDLKSIVFASLVIGLITVIITDISLMNWYMFPLDYSIVNILDKLVSFGLLGLLFGLYTFRVPKFLPNQE